jgi:hypothetical protein
MDLNGDGVITELEMKEYTEIPAELSLILLKLPPGEGVSLDDLEDMGFSAGKMDLNGDGYVDA